MDADTPRAEGAVAGLPVNRLTVRVIQPGRSRLVSAHVLLDAGYGGGLGQLDEARAQVDTALKAEHPTTVADLIFTADERWSAPLAHDAAAAKEA